MTAAAEQFIAGPLRWTSTGSVLATWWLKEPLQIARCQGDALDNISLERGLWEALAGHRYWFESMVCWTSPSTIAEAMLSAGRDQVPGYGSIIDQTLDQLDEHWLGHRRHFLTVELSTGLHDSITRTGRAAASSIMAMGGLTPLAPSAKEYENALDRAEDFRLQIPAEYQARPVTPEIMEWARRHHIRRTGEDFTTLITDADRALLDIPQSAARLEGAALDPSGISTLPKHQRSLAPWKHKWVAVTDEDGETNYQAHLIMRSVPRNLSWPSMEFLRRIDDSGVQVDYSIVGLGRSRSDAQQRNAKALTQLNNQVDQVEGGTVGTANSHLSRLQSAASVLDTYNEDFTDDESLVEHEPVIIASICADSPEKLEQEVKTFLAMKGPVKWARPIGAEDAAFMARQPGGEITSELHAYHQVTHSVTMATMGAVTTSRLGHETGLPLFIDETLPLRRAVLWEPFGEGHEYKQRAAAMATMGEQGSGKTYCGMTLSGVMVDTGARLVATDTTAEREWTIFADSLGTNTEVAKVDFEFPVSSVDPLRCLPLKDGAKVTEQFLSTLLDLQAMSAPSIALKEALSTSFLAEHHIDSIPKLLANIGKVQRAGAGELHDLLDVWCDKDKYPAIFDLDLPPVSTTSQCLIWGTHGIKMPTDKELSTEHLFRRMDESKRMGRAIYALFSWFSTHLCLRNPNEAAYQNIDEFHHILASPEATEGQMEFLRYLRHMRAMTHYQTQLGEIPADMLSLIGTRLALRVQSSSLDAAVQFLLGDQADAEQRAAVKEMVSSHNAPGRGAGVLRMYRGAEAQLGKVQVLPPSTEARRTAAGASASTETTVFAG
ncbi:ATP-binding protein [Luteococcus sp.]|uniref:ATP-binding protein n=1 Tax=Luteococcus sp. TaxID=1969402 RepID=UPI003735BB17